MRNRLHYATLRPELPLLFTLLFLLASIGIPRAQQAIAPVTARASQEAAQTDRVALHQALLDLTNPWTVMCIAAHPDDEDGTSLIVMRHKYGAHTVSLFSTFGEGGQNAIGPELYEEMGAIRARETMAAAEIQGSEPHFLGLKDFGFSKSADEAFKFWGHEESLRRMVLQIRQLRPDVIITNHSATSNDHGHHQATARLELEAFEAAADAKRFPEQLKDGVETWQVQRLFVRARGNQTPADNAGLVTIDPNERDAVTGEVYAEQALRALQKHATQGPWPKSFADMLRFRNSQDGKLPLIRYRLTREAKGTPALPGESHNFVDGLKLPDSVVSEIDLPAIDEKPLIEFADDRAKVLELLLKQVRKGFRFQADKDWANYVRVSKMRARIERATAIAAGVSLKVEAPDRIAIQNSHPEFKVHLTNNGTQTVSVLRCVSGIPSLENRNDVTRKGGPTSILESSQELKSSSTMERATQVLIPAKAPINLPLATHLYEPTGLGLQVRTGCAIAFGQGFNDRISVDETTIIDVAPAVEIAEITPSPLILTPNVKGAAGNPPRKASFSLKLINHQQTAFNGNLIATDDLADSRGDSIGVKLAAGETRTVSFMVARPEPPAGVNVMPRNSLTFFLQNSQVNSPSRNVPVVYADARVVPQVRVGYVRGFDFSLPNALTALGVESKELSIDEVKTADLAKYTSIIVDNRVYESQPELIAANQKLLDYANAGGTLIVFYHKSDEWNPDERRKRPQLAPYKLILGNERVTDETAAITFLEPEHPLLNFPNKMGQEDFANWIQERGLYYPRDWDPQFHALLQSNDPGESPLKGGLLVADYGKGHYIYTSMVWYRELRGGIPGAYRMLANMISYGRGPK